VDADGEHHPVEREAAAGVCVGRLGAGLGA
jgi:hypothetical protein